MKTKKPLMSTIKKEEGYTLVESILVLFVVGLLFSFPILSFQNVGKDVEVELFFEELSSNITLMQNHAILNGESTYIQPNPEFNSITFGVRGNRNHPLSHEISMPDSVSLVGTIRRYDFLRYSGNLGNLSPLRMDTHKGRYELVFQMGSGRFEIREW